MMYSTEDALASGITATAAQKKWWEKLRWEFSRQCYAAMNREQFDLGIMFATQSQFYREALEAETIAPAMKRLFSAGKENKYEGL